METLLKLIDSKELLVKWITHYIISTDIADLRDLFGFNIVLTFYLYVTPRENLIQGSKNFLLIGYANVFTAKVA